MSKSVERDLREEICEVGRRVYNLGFVAGNDGNISARLGCDRILCTPTGVSKGFLTPDMLVECDLDGRQIAGGLKVTSEILMHVESYKLRSKLGGIVHAHPPTATGFAVAGIELTERILPEVVVNLGGVPLAAYGTPGGPEIFRPLIPFIKGNFDAVLLANHGAITFGSGVMDAHFKMETVELCARITLVARQLGNTNKLHDIEVEALRKRFNAYDKPSCFDRPIPS